MTSAEFTTVAIAYNMKKMISVMYAERAKAVASEGRATLGTEVGADISGWRQSDKLAAARRDGGRVNRSRRFCYWAKSPTLLTPSEASSLAVQSQPSAKNATDNQLSVTHLLNPQEAGSPAVESHPVGCKLSVALNQLRPSI